MHVASVACASEIWCLETQGQHPSHTFSSACLRTARATLKTSPWAKTLNCGRPLRSLGCVDLHRVSFLSGVGTRDSASCHVAGGSFHQPLRLCQPTFRGPFLEQGAGEALLRPTNAPRPALFRTLLVSKFIEHQACPIVTLTSPQVLCSVLDQLSQAHAQLSTCS